VEHELHVRVQCTAILAVKALSRFSENSIPAQRIAEQCASTPTSKVMTCFDGRLRVVLDEVAVY
jgi:hypothetical protein